jgi:hypothetical protein
VEILSWSGFSWVGDELIEGGKMTNNEGKSSKLSAAIERLRKLGVRVTDGTCKGMAIGIVGGVRRPESKSVEDDDSPISPNPSVN